jgi:hypothetical protein
MIFPWNFKFYQTKERIRLEAYFGSLQENAFTHRFLRKKLILLHSSKFLTTINLQPQELQMVLPLVEQREDQMQYVG